MKIVTMCQGGHVRSVGLKYILKYVYGHDVLACGWESNSEETRRMLFEWADAIIIMQKEMIKFVPTEFHDSPNGRKLFCYDVGPDNYGNPFHPQLQVILKQMVLKHGVFTK